MPSNTSPPFTLRIHLLTVARENVVLRIACRVSFGHSTCSINRIVRTFIGENWRREQFIDYFVVKEITSEIRWSLNENGWIWFLDLQTWNWNFMRYGNSWNFFFFFSSPLESICWITKMTINDKNFLNLTLENFFWLMNNKILGKLSIVRYYYL